MRKKSQRWLKYSYRYIKINKPLKEKFPNFHFEKPLWKKGYKFVGGVDEVGRGSFVGPVIAAICVFSPNTVIDPKIRINDSKKLTSRQREISDKWIKKNSSWGVGEGSVSEINRLGIIKATEIAFRKAIKKVNPDYLLIDAFYIPFVRGLRRRNQKAIVKGDTKSLSIAAASIIAKVHRDELMTALGKKSEYRKYGWDTNKGYGTLKHRNAIKKYGITKLHRSDYVVQTMKFVD